jgi:conjugative relaxase-like TrwC/TraI family protein
MGRLAAAARLGWWVMLTIAKLSRWSVNYYNDTARAAGQAAQDLQRAGGGLGEYYGEHDTRTPTWLCAGDTHAAAALVGLSDVERAGGQADPEVVARWLDDGAAPNGVCGRGFGKRSVHGFDLTFSAPKSVSLFRALRDEEVSEKAVLDAHTTAISEAMEYLATHAGYSRVHNPATGEKDLIRLPGLVTIAYQHETSRAGDPHLHTHVLVPNRQARADGQLVSVDGTSLYHEAKAAGVIYQATLRRELHRALGLEWAPVDPHTGMAEIAGIDPKTITAWSQRSSALREWAADNLVVVDAAAGPSAAQLAAAQKATRPSKPEQLAWAALVQDWRADARGLRFDRDAFTQARAARRAWSAASKAPLDRRRLLGAAEAMDKATFTRADLVEVIGAQLPVDTERGPRQMVEAAVDALGLRVNAPRLVHQREGHDRFTLEAFLAEEQGVLDLVDAQDVRAQIWVNEHDSAGLSPDQQRAVHNVAGSPWLVCPLSAPAGAGKTTSLRALASAARRFRGQVMVVAPTGKAVDVAIREGAGDVGYTVAKAVKSLRDGTLTLRRPAVVIVDEAAMVGTDDLRRLLTATTKAGVKAVLVGDAHQLSPVKARGGMFAQLCADLPWTQTLSEVWRMRDPEERSASLAVRDGGPAPVRRAVDWYRRHDRLHTGDDIAMAADALQAYRVDTAAGKDTLLVCDTTEMCDALNRRIHDESIDAALPTVTAARGQRIAMGDVIISRRNDPTNPVHDATDFAKAVDPVRNGQRWRVFAVDAEHGRIAARRLDDGARVAFTGDYLQEHITHGYAVTVHSAQGVTAEATHAVLGEKTSRNLLYVALTRGRESNTAYLYERRAGETEHEHAAQLEPSVHVARRGTSREAAHLVRAIIGNRDDQARTAHDIAAHTHDRTQLPQRVQHLLDQHTNAVQTRRRIYRQSIQVTVDERIEQQRFIDAHLSRDREQGLDYGLEL